MGSAARLTQTDGPTEQEQRVALVADEIFVQRPDDGKMFPRMESAGDGSEHSSHSPARVDRSLKSRGALISRKS
jgi:hypothetical protein